MVYNLLNHYLGHQLFRPGITIGHTDSASTVFLPLCFCRAFQYFWEHIDMVQALCLNPNTDIHTDIWSTEQTQIVLFCYITIIYMHHIYSIFYGIYEPMTRLSSAISFDGPCHNCPTQWAHHRKFLIDY